MRFFEDGKIRLISHSATGLLKQQAVHNNMQYIAENIDPKFGIVNWSLLVQRHLQKMQRMADILAGFCVPFGLHVNLLKVSLH